MWVYPLLYNVLLFCAHSDQTSQTTLTHFFRRSVETLIHFQFSSAVLHEATASTIWMHVWCGWCAGVILKAERNTYYTQSNWSIQLQLQHLAATTTWNTNVYNMLSLLWCLYSVNVFTWSIYSAVCILSFWFANSLYTYMRTITDRARR